MFGKDKSQNDTELEKAPTSFSNSQSQVIPKSTAKDAKAGGKMASTTLIARDTEIFGDIKFSGSLEIEGSIVGNITANPGSEASVRVLENGDVEGDIQAPKMMINGHVKGNVFAGNLELAAKAKVEGNVHYESIEMVKGSQVNGSLLFADKPANHQAAPAAVKKS
jgi:cytoskeletal protein CcmA (bactofilin family)